jgi:hypothetical protein
MTLDKLLEVIYQSKVDTIEVEANLLIKDGMGYEGNYGVLTLKIGGQTFNFDKSSGNWEQNPEPIP